MEHPYGLAHSDNFLYWTEFQNGTVQRLNMTDLNNLTVITLSVENHPLYELRVFDNSTQEGKTIFKPNFILRSRTFSPFFPVCRQQ